MYYCEENYVDDGQFLSFNAIYGVNDFGEMKQHDDHDDDGGGEILYNILNAQIYKYIYE